MRLTPTGRVKKIFWKKMIRELSLEVVIDERIGNKVEERELPKPEGTFVGQCRGHCGHRRLECYRRKGRKATRRVSMQTNADRHVYHIQDGVLLSFSLYPLKKSTGWGQAGLQLYVHEM